MLIILGAYRLKQLFPLKKIVIHAHPHEHGEKHHEHLHVHVGNIAKHSHPHSLAYGVGLIHGLAGSGALIIMVMVQIKEPLNGLFYLVIFGLGSIGGMLTAAGLFSIPFSKKNYEGTKSPGNVNNYFSVIMPGIRWISNL